MPEIDCSNRIKYELLHGSNAFIYIIVIVQSVNMTSEIQPQEIDTQLSTQTNANAPYLFEVEVDLFLNSSGKYARLPIRDGETKTYQFINDKSKRKLVKKRFKDPATGEEKGPEQTKVEYPVIDQMIADQGEKLLDVPKTVALDVEANLAKGRALLEITRHGNVPNVRYTVTAE
ncbi:MAG: hypothetical protein ACRD8W_32050 [Nitrososphaeraceae archaeon]